MDDAVTGIDLELPRRLPDARPAVTFGSEWNAWRSLVMPQPPRKPVPVSRRPGVRVLSLAAIEYPAAATGQGYTSGRVTLGHLTSSEWLDASVQRLPAPKQRARLAAPTAPKTGGSTESTAR